MSRTVKGGKPAGLDYSGAYKCNKNYAAGPGAVGKRLAKKERRKDGKKAVRSTTNEEEI